MPETIIINNDLLIIWTQVMNGLKKEPGVKRGHAHLKEETITMKTEVIKITTGRSKKIRIGLTGYNRH